MAEASKKPKAGNMVELGSMLFLVAVLIGFIIPGNGQIQKRALDRENVAKCHKNLLAMHEAMERYLADSEGRYPTDLNLLVRKKMLPEIPMCPAADPKKGITYTRKGGYKYRQADPGRYTIVCVGNSHIDAGLQLNEPLYDSVYGLKPAPGVGPTEK